MIENKKGWMYILTCSNGAYYTGSTNNLNLRLQQHQSGNGANFTKKHLPVVLVYSEEYARVQDAFYREKQIQGWSRKKKEALIQGFPEKLHGLAECKNESHFKNAPFDSAQGAIDSAQGAIDSAQGAIQSSFRLRSKNKIELETSSLSEVETKDNEIETSSLSEVKTKDNEIKTSSLSEVKTKDNEIETSSLSEAETKDNEIETSSLSEAETNDNEAKTSSLSEVETNDINIIPNQND